ncbi:MAG: stage V sporulation protein AD [Clostridia bacterium]|nr:stage V sporulation protein AD [Clostridia bacterium]
MAGRIFVHKEITVSSFAAVGGKEEKAGPLGAYLDYHEESGKFGAKTWELAEGEMGGLALQFALAKEKRNPKDVSLVFAGDLQNQCVATTHGLLPFSIPYLGIYGACSTCTEGLLLSALALSNPSVVRCAALTSSHFCAAERQFRLPLEYGGQRAPTAQWTATAAGAFLLCRYEDSPHPVRLTLSASMAGRAVDGGLSDASNMGAAMAPAAADSILTFLSETDTSPEEYDAIVTGDLGSEGTRLLHQILADNGVSLGERHRDCGMLLYDKDKQDIHAGASGCGCSAAVLAAYFLPALSSGKLRKILFLSTGALMSPSSIEQGEDIVGIAPVICLQSGKENHFV